MSIEARISTIANGFSAAQLARVASLQVPISFLPPIELKDLTPDILCGQNLGLKDLTDKKTLIKLLLRIPKVKGIAGSVQRNASVVKLVALAATVKEKYEMVQSKIEAVYSFQNDIASIKSDPSPANIARVAQRYKGKVPGLDRYIQLASDITNTTELDFCDLIPNISFNPETGAVSVNAKKSLFPSENPEAAELLIPSIKDFFTDKSKSPSGISLDRLQEYKTEVPEEIQKQVLDPAQEKQREKIEEYLTQEKVVKNQGIAEKTKKYGKTYQELKETGLLTVDEIKSIDSLKSQEIKTSLYKAIPSWLIQYSDSEQMALIETASESEKTAIKQSYLDIFEGNADSTAYPEEAAFYQSSLAKIDSIREVNKQLILDYVAHNKYLSPSDTESANVATKNLVSLKEAPIHINTVARPTNQRGFA